MWYDVKDNSNAENDQLIEKSIANTKKELKKENTKLDKIYDFLENRIFIIEMQNEKGTMIPKLENVIDLYDS